jgi:hypothetical protein
LSLNQIEWQICEFTKGTVSIIVIAEQLGEPVEKIEQVAFRLIVVGLVEEVSIILEPPDELYELESTMIDIKFEPRKQENTVSQSFFSQEPGWFPHKQGLS